MAPMTQQEREKLARELAELSFNKASGKVRRLDARGRLAYFRNSQSPTQLYTRYELPTLGVAVTLIEGVEEKAIENSPRFKSEYKLQEVIVEALN